MWEGPGQYGEMVLVYLRKQSEQVIRSKSVAAYLQGLYEFLPLGSYLEFLTSLDGELQAVRWNKLFPPTQGLLEIIF